MSNKADCRDRHHPTVIACLCSAQVEYSGRHDVLVRRSDGGLLRDSIVQTDLLFVLNKTALTDDRDRGVLMADTLRQIRAKISDTLGISGTERM